MSRRSLHLEVLEKISQLATAGFGLVAALAWNDLIQSLFRKVFGTQSELLAKFGYALVITVLVVFVTVRLGSLTDSVKQRLADGHKDVKQPGK